MSSDFSSNRKVEEDLFTCINDYPPPMNTMKRENDSTDDFEHLENEQTRHQANMKRLSDALLADVARNLQEDSDQEDQDEDIPQMGFERESPTLPATPPPSASSADFIKFEEKHQQDTKKDTLMSFMEAEKRPEVKSNKNEIHFDDDELAYLQPEKVAEVKIQEPTADLLMMSSEMDFKKDFQDSPENRSTPDLMAADSPKFERYTTEKSAYDDDWKDADKESEKFEKFDNKFDKMEEDLGFAPTKPLPPEPREDFSSGYKSASDKYGFSSGQGDSEFESGSEPSPIKSSVKPKEKVQAPPVVPKHRYDIEEIAPQDIFKHLKLDAWFNPERLNPKVAALIYWRDPKKSGIVFGAILVVLLSLAYFSLISVVAYLSLLTLTGTICYRIYKTVLQAIQKTSDGHPFKDILELDLTLPAEKVHEFADVAVANANAAVRQLRRLFLVEDIVDSIKFASLLWIMTYVGAWFNGMTLVILGVVALFTLPKVYETNKVQIDQNLALVQAKVNEITAKVKAAIPLGKKAEPTKEE